MNDGRPVTAASDKAPCNRSARDSLRRSREQSLNERTCVCGFSGHGCLIECSTSRVRSTMGTCNASSNDKTDAAVPAAVSAKVDELPSTESSALVERTAVGDAEDRCEQETSPDKSAVQVDKVPIEQGASPTGGAPKADNCLLYTSDAADD